MAKRKRNVNLVSAKVDAETLEFLKSRRKYKNEPLDQVIHRIIQVYTTSKEDMEKMVEGLRRVNDIYLDRIHEYENGSRIDAYT